MQFQAEARVILLQRDLPFIKVSLLAAQFQRSPNIGATTLPVDRVTWMQHLENGQSQLCVERIKNRSIVKLAGAESTQVVSMDFIEAHNEIFAFCG